MNFLSGKKMLIVVVLTAVSTFVNLLTGYDLGQWLRILVVSIGWGDELANPAVGTASEIVVAGFAIWAAFKGLLRIFRERAAGASLREAGTVVGETKFAIAAGIIPAVAIKHPDEATPLSPSALEKIMTVNKAVL